MIHTLQTKTQTHTNAHNAHRPTQRQTDILAHSKKSSKVFYIIFGEILLRLARVLKRKAIIFPSIAGL